MALSPEQEKAAAFDDSPNRNEFLYAFLQLALFTGMRMGELYALLWSQIDLKRNVITVGKAKSEAGTGREIPMNPEVRAIVDQHASWYAKKFGEIKPEWFVFPGGVTRAMKPDSPLLSLNSSWDSVRKRAGVDCRFHDLGHTLGTTPAAR